MTNRTGDAIGIGIILVVFCLALATMYLWGFGSGFREGYTMANQGMEKALQGGYDIGLEKGLSAVEIKDRKGK